MTKKNLLRWAVTIFAAFMIFPFLAVSCGGGDEDDGGSYTPHPTTPDQTKPPTSEAKPSKAVFDFSGTIAGNDIRQPVEGLTVTFTELQNTKPGKVTATGRTDSGGNFETIIAVDSYGLEFSFRMVVSDPRAEPVYERYEHDFTIHIDDLKPGENDGEEYRTAFPLGVFYIDPIPVK